MRNGDADEAAVYTRYAERCVETAKTLRDREERSPLREMAAEWLRLAERIAEEAVLAHDQVQRPAKPA